MAQSPIPSTSFVRAIGVRQLTAAIINTTVGAGIFVLPALVAQGLGAAAPLAFLVCAGIMALMTATIAMAGSRVSLTGGIYAYVQVAFGPYVALLAGVLQWLTGIVAVAGVAAALVDQLGTFAPAIAFPQARLGILAATFAALAQVNARGVRLGTRLIEVVTVTKLLPLLTFVIAGAFFVDLSRLAWPALPDAEALGRAVLLLIFAYVGVETALAPSGEVRAPARTVPRAAFLALAIITALYIAIQLVAQGVLGPSLADATGAPLALAAGTFLGAAGVTLLLLGAVASMFGYLCGDMLSTPRSWYALARDGFLPRVLTRIHPVHRTPSSAIWIHALLMLLLASTNTFEGLAIIGNVAVLVLYLLCCGAALQLARRDVRAEAAPFTLRGAAAYPIAAAALVLWILSTASAREMLVTALVMGAATLAYLVRKQGQSRSMRTLAAALLAAGLAVACGPSEPLQIANLQLGRSLNPDNSVSAHTTRFKPDDTVYVSLLSDEPGAGTITVRWLFHGQVVSEATREVSYTRAAATEFHLQNSGGFPPGPYRVDILINGEPAGSREFRVES